MKREIILSTKLEDQIELIQDVLKLFKTPIYMSILSSLQELKGIKDNMLKNKVSGVKINVYRKFKYRLAPNYFSGEMEEMSHLISVELKVLGKKYATSPYAIQPIHLRRVFADMLVKCLKVYVDDVFFKEKK